MKVIFFDSKAYDKESFTKELVNYPDIEVKFLKTELTPFTAELAHGYDAVCAFVSADISNDTIEDSEYVRRKTDSSPLRWVSTMLKWKPQRNSESVFSVYPGILRKQLLSNAGSGSGSQPPSAQSICKSP